MLTVDELAAFPLFSTLQPAQLGEITKYAADIHLAPGQYAIHDGEAAAFYAVLTGKLEITGVVDGVERAFGYYRVAGQISGEIPLTYGMPFQYNALAVEPTRVLRLDARHYYSLAAGAPAFAKEVRALAEYRMSGPRGFQGLVAEARAPQVTLFGPRWDNACHAFRQFLSRNQINFDWVAPEEDDAASRWEGPLPSDRERPVLRMGHGAILVEPSFRDLAERLGLQTVPRLAEYDTVVIGGGPAGLAAAVYGASEGLRTLVIEREAPGGQAGTSSRIENYLGFPSGISGDDLADRALRQAKRLGAEILITRRDIEKIDTDTPRHSSRRREFASDADDHHRHRRELAAPGNRRLRQPDRQGDLLRRGAERGEPDARARRPSHRRRELGRPGSNVLRQPRPQRHAAGSRRRA